MSTLIFFLFIICIKLAPGIDLASIPTPILLLLVLAAVDVTILIYEERNRHK